MAFAVVFLISLTVLNNEYWEGGLTNCDNFARNPKKIY